MRIAFVTGDAPWPPTAGGRLRDIATYEAAASVGDVVLVVFPFAVEPDLAALPAGTWVERMPWPRSSSARLAKRIRATVHGRHVFQQHLIEMGALTRLETALAAIDPDVTIMGYPLYSDLLRVARAASPRLVVDMTELRVRDARARRRSPNPLTDRALATLDAHVLVRVERDVARFADEVWFVTEEDAVGYRRMTGVPTRVVPNTVPAGELARYRTVAPRPNGYAYLGAFDHRTNARAAERLVRRIHPIVRRSVPAAHLTLIGRRPSADLRRLVDTTAGVTLRADVADAVGELAASGPLVAPLEWGSGTKLKLLEAAAAGVPIITSPQGLDGLDLQHDRDLLVATTDQGFSDALVRLWSDGVQRERVRQGALACVLARYDRPVAAQSIRTALRSLVPDA